MDAELERLLGAAAKLDGEDILGYLMKRGFVMIAELRKVTEELEIYKEREAHLNDTIELLHKKYVEIEKELDTWPDAIADEMDQRMENTEGWMKKALAMERERDEVTARTMHLARGFRKNGAPVYEKAAELLESFVAFPTAGEPVVKIVADHRDKLQADNIKMKKALELIATCEVRFPGDVVSIAKEVLREIS